MNVVNLIGYVSKDPELRHTNATKQAVVNLSLATREEFTDKEGVTKHRTEWHRIVCWGKIADQAAASIREGDRIGIEGKLQSRKWSDAQGKSRSTVEVTVVKLHLLELEEDPA